MACMFHQNWEQWNYSDKQRPVERGRKVGLSSPILQTIYSRILSVTEEGRGFFVWQVRMLNLSQSIL